MHNLKKEWVYTFNWIRCMQLRFCKYIENVREISFIFSLIIVYSLWKSLEWVEIKKEIKSFSNSDFTDYLLNFFIILILTSFFWLYMNVWYIYLEKKEIIEKLLSHIFLIHFFSTITQVVKRVSSLSFLYKLKFFNSY